MPSGARLVSISLFALTILTAALLVAGTGQAAAAAQYMGTSLHISNSATGGDCTTVGAWNAGTKTCTLANDLDFSSGAGVVIDSDGVTLSGAGHTLTGAGDGSADGVYLTGRSSVLIENLSVSSFNNGINVDTSKYCTIMHVTTAANSASGINVNASAYIRLDGNNSSSDAVGINLNNSSGNTVSANTVLTTTGGDGISMQGSSNNTLTGNISNGNAGNGFCIDPGNNNNQFLDNMAENNAGNAFWLNMSNGNTIRGNTTMDNNPSGNGGSMGGMGMAGMGEIALNGSSNNVIYQNNFIGSAQPQASVSGGSGNSFNMPSPAGGNYWSSWTSPDANGDGFVDTPYMFMGGQDNLPWTAPNEWARAKSTLMLGSPAPFWASSADYSAGLLSVKWTVTNTGDVAAYGLTIDGSSNTDGVSVPAGVLPASLGTLGSGASRSFTMKYNVPAGIAVWISTLSGHGQDAGGDGYTYP